MSTNPPQPPYQPPPPPPGGQPYVDPATELEATKKKQRTILIVGGLVSLALIVGAFFFGQSQEKSKYDAGQPAYNAIYKAGAEAGSAVGTAKGTKQGQKEGEAAGTEAGKKSGLQEGEDKGINTGQQQGADAALGGLSGWDTSLPYVVEFNTGPNANIPFAIDKRTLMQQGVLYKLCSDGTGLCTETASAASTDTPADGGATP